MEFHMMSGTPNPEELICRMARNDYYAGCVVTDSFEQVMAGVKEGHTIEEKMESLLRKTMIRGHWGVFEHPQLNLWAQMSRACMAQITRHRFISFDIQSMRYVNFKDPEFYIPDEHWGEPELGHYKVKTRKGVRNIPANIGDTFADHYTNAVDYYNALVAAGVPVEDARFVLPIGCKVNVGFSMNARTALHVISMRGAGDAQSEIRELSSHIADTMRDYMPMTMKIWDENRRAIDMQRLNP